MKKQKNNKPSEHDIDVSHIQVKLKPLGPFSPGIYLFVLYSAILLGAVLFLLTGYGLSKNRRDFHIDSTPQGAEVRFNDLYQGITPFRGTIPAGEGVISLYKPGYQIVETPVEGKRQILLLGAGFFAPTAHHLLTPQSEKPLEVVEQWLREWSLWSRVGSFGQRQKEIEVFREGAQRPTFRLAPGGEYFMPQLGQWLLDFSQDFPDLDWNNILLDLALYSNDQALLDQILLTVGKNDLSLTSQELIFSALHNLYPWSNAAFPELWMLENSALARYQFQHDNALGNTYQRGTGAGKEFFPPGASTLQDHVKQYLSEGSIGTKYRESLNRPLPQKRDTPKPLGSITVGPLNFRIFSPGISQIEENFLSPYDALFYLEKAPVLAFQTPEFALGTNPISPELWSLFEKERPDYRNKLDSTGFYPAPEMLPLSSQRRATGISYLQLEAFTQWFNETYSSALGDWKAVIPGEDLWQAAYFSEKDFWDNDNNGPSPSGLRELASDFLEWTSHYYAPGTILLSPWEGTLIHPRTGFEKVLRGSRLPEKRVALPITWEAPLASGRLALVKEIE